MYLWLLICQGQEAFAVICADDASPDAVSLAKDVSGNFVVQKLFDIGLWQTYGMGGNVLMHISRARMYGMVWYGMVWYVMLSYVM